MITTCVLAASLMGLPRPLPLQKAILHDRLHTPRKGSAEEQGILKALHGRDNTYFRQAAAFKLAYLKVHNGWAWVDATPLDRHRKPTAEGGAALLHLTAGQWKLQNLSKIPSDPENPMGPDDPSPVYIKNLRKQFPEVPTDILPKPRG